MLHHRLNLQGDSLDFSTRFLPRFFNTKGLLLVMFECSFSSDTWRGFFFRLWALLVQLLRALVDLESANPAFQVRTTHMQIIYWERNNGILGFDYFSASLLSCRKVMKLEVDPNNCPSALTYNVKKSYTTHFRYQSANHLITIKNTEVRSNEIIWNQQR